MKSTKYLAMSLLALSLIGCNSGSTASSGGTTTSTSSARIAPMGTLLGSSANSVTYYATLTNTGTEELWLKGIDIAPLSTANAASSTGAATFTCTSSICSGATVAIPAGGSLTFGIEFNAGSATDPSQLTAEIQAALENGQQQQVVARLDISGVRLDPPTVTEILRLRIDMPTVIVPDANYTASGALTMLNSSSDDYTINTDTITAGSMAAAAGFRFTPLCDGGRFGRVIAAGQACTVFYEYDGSSQAMNSDSAAATASNGLVNLTIPVTDNNTGETANLIASTIIEPRLDSANPKPRLTASIGMPIYLVPGGAAGFALANYGNAAMGGVDFLGLGAITVQASACDNVAEYGGTCQGTLALAAEEEAPASVTIAAKADTQELYTITLPIATQALGVSRTFLTFGNVTAPTQQSLYVANLSLAPLSDLSIALNGSSSTALRGSNGDAAFRIAPTSTCGTTLAALSVCALDVVYTPFSSTTAASSSTNGSLTIGASGQTSVTVDMGGV